MKPAKLDTYPVAYVEGLAARVAELEAENKDLRKRAELADGDVKRAQAILDASSRYIRRLEVDLQSESQAKIDAEFHVAALKERVAEMEERCKRLEEAGDAVMDAAYNAQGWDGTRLGNALEAWVAAKEAKP